MPHVHIVRHKPAAIFSNPVEVIIVDDKQNVVRIVEPSGMVGTQYAKEIGSQWLGTVENLNGKLAAGRLSWADVYKTDVLWTTPSDSREECDAFKNAFNTLYKPIIAPICHSTLVSNRMARFTHPEGFPNPAALFEVQVKAVQGESVNVGGGKIDYGYWQDHQPSGLSTNHTNAAGETFTFAPGPRGADHEFNFIMQQFETKLGADCKTRCVWVEILVAVDELGRVHAAIWGALEASLRAMCAYFPAEHRPAGVIQLVSRIPNMDGTVEVSPRVVSGDVTITRSPGQLSGGFSNWTSITAGGITEVMVSAITNNGVGLEKTSAVLDQIDGFVKEAGGTSLKVDGVFNSAYVLATEDSAASRARIAEFNKHFIAWYGEADRPGRTAQFLGGVMSEGQEVGISSRAIFVAGQPRKL